MESFDIMCTATLRPDLLKRTFDSHIDNLFGDHIEKARLFINVDPVGSDTPQKTINQLLKYIDSYPFKEVAINITPSPSFSQAFCWCLGQLSSKYTFSLEEDWEMIKKLDFDKMIELMEEDPTLAHLRLSSFGSNGTDKMKVWNKFIKWNGHYFEVPRNLRGTIGWAGHPSLNRTSFLLFFRSIMNPKSNPEKQIKGAYPIIMNSRFGVFQPKEKTPPIIKDIGRQWMEENGYQKKGTKAFFTEWEKTNE